MLFGVREWLELNYPPIARYVLYEDGMCFYSRSDPLFADGGFGARKLDHCALRFGLTAQDAAERRRKQAVYDAEIAQLSTNAPVEPEEAWMLYHRVFRPYADPMECMELLPRYDGARYT